MKTFGMLLREYRSRCTDREGRRLTQERLGEYLGETIGDYGVTGATISNWERDRHQIHKDHQMMLIALLQILTELGGIQGREDADMMLASGNYHVDEVSLREIFPDAVATPDEEPPFSRSRDGRYLVIVLDDLPARLWGMFRLPEMSTDEGLVRGWSGRLIFLLGWPFRHLSSGDIFRLALWVTAWLLTYGLTFPLMDWPFAAADAATSAAIRYVAGSLAVPVLLAILAANQGGLPWRDEPSVSSLVHYLYVFQGASIGFHISYMGVFGSALFFYYLDSLVNSWPLPIWLGALVAVGPILLGYAAAQQVPHNLWLAFGRLALRDGFPFFIFVLYGPLWAVFFLEIYPTLLSVPTGMAVILLAVLTMTGFSTWRKRRNKYARG